MRQGFIKIVAAGLTLTGCSFAARSAEMYRKDTRELLATRNGDLDACYETAHDKDKSLAGTVVVRFTLESDTGKIVDTKVLEGDTTAPEPLQQCVLDSLEGLALKPGDERQGDATFTWKFEQQ